MPTTDHLPRLDAEDVVDELEEEDDPGAVLNPVTDDDDDELFINVVDDVNVEGNDNDDKDDDANAVDIISYKNEWMLNNYNNNIGMLG